MMRRKASRAMTHRQGAQWRQQQVGEPAGDRQSARRDVRGAGAEVVARDERRQQDGVGEGERKLRQDEKRRSEEHTSELQSLMRISYAVFCLKKKKYKHQIEHTIKETKLI